ncbi:MAG: lipid-A-disaccharide synthase N-terminal domain-containing protein [Phycisphaerales bacterium]
MKPHLLSICVITLIGLASTPSMAQSPDASTSEIKLKLNAVILQTPQGLRYRIDNDHGGALLLTPDEFSTWIYRQQTSRSFTERLFNISTPFGIAWVALGLLGQVLFTGRMIVQWLVSEKAKRSVVPPLFWWLSLLGATMLTLYFLWRQDIVGVLGQAFGWLIYTRNLWMIYRPHNPHPVPVTNDPAPEPELEQ